ncbi:MAG TPA: DNA repair exonuclease [Candidatus Acidoferrales bacterium]|nr:DNA repair exonuclease [Candidatus Acidoferrales bacterium]
MKIAIVSDTHIGYERFAEDALKQATEALEKASTLADIILLPGDVFDKRAPRPDVIAQSINLFRELSKKKWAARVVEFNGRGTKCYTDVPVVAISGTHERTAEGKDNPLNLLGLAGLLIDTSEATTIIEKDGERVAIFGLGGISEERVKEKLAELKPTPISGAFNVFMLHQSIYEILPFSNDFIHYDDLPSGFDLYVNGHIHSRVDATVHGKKFLIPGSTVLTQFKEGEQGNKGFILFDTKSYTYEFIEIATREFVVRNLEFSDATPKEVDQRCEAEIESILSHGSAKPIIKINLKGTIKSGFTGSDMPIHALLLKYSEKAVLEIESGKLVSPEVQMDIEGIRENKIGEMPIKELGMNIFSARLKELDYDQSSISASDLFNILSTAQNKEKAVKEAMELLDSSN